MAQIRSKQIADFLNTVNFVTLSTEDKTKIANAADTKLYIDAQISGLTGTATASIDALETALSAEISSTDSDFVRVEADYAAADSIEKARAIAAEGVLTAALSAEIVATNADFTSVNTRVSTEEGRVNAILLAADADKDSFAEIVSLINAVDTTNDGALAAYVLSNNAALSAEISATDADFTSVNTRATNIETLNTAQNASIDSLEVALTAEISSTNSDFVRVEAAYAAADSIETARAIDAEEVLTAALSAEISATDVDFTSVNTRVSGEISRAIAAEGLISTELVNEVASIDTRLGAVSGDLVSSVDSLEVVLAGEISATQHFTGYITYNNTLNTAQNASIDSLEVALTAEINATNGEFVSINSRVSVEEGRVDAILLASSADKDSFAEIVSLINAVDTTNDGALAAYVLSNNAALSTEIASTNSDFVVVNASIDSLEVALSAEISATDADFASVDTRVSNLTADLAAEISATNGEVTDINTSLDSLEVALTAEISATNSDVTRIDEEVSAEIARATSVEVTQDDRLTSLEGYIMEDAEEVIETFVGAGQSYLVSFLVQDGNKKLVKAYVNGIFVEVESASMQNEGRSFVSLVNTAYTIDANDTVTFVYQKA